MTYFSKKITLLITLLFGLISSAQEIEIKGVILDENTKNPIEFATVQIETTKNHRLLGYGFSNEKGKFELEANLKKETDISLVVTYIGFTTYKKILSTNNLHKNIGSIFLHETVEKLEEVIITATPPILIKNDTIQYNASSFKTKEDAVAEDLLKKLPGISIDNEDGSVKVHGIDVTKILVNGEPFFSDNPKAAIKILSKDIIDKIEITDTKTDEENYTGSVSSEESKTINIKLKKKKLGNTFGNITAGYGINNRYETNGILNRIYKKSLLTVLGFSNNINKNNFSYNDQAEANTLDNLRALKTESNFGTNYSDKFTDDHKINIDYLFSDLAYNQQTKTEGSILQPERTNFITENNRQNTLQKSHRGNFKLTNTIFKDFKLITNAKFYNRNKTFERTNNKETKNDNNELINTKNGRVFQNQKYQALNSSIRAIYKFKKLNSYTNYKIFTTSNSSLNNYSNKSETHFFGSHPRNVIRDQLTEQNRYDTRIGNSFKYGQRIGKGHVIEYEFTNRNEKKEETKEVLDISNSNTLLNNNLSFDQKIDINKQENQISYLYKQKKFFYNLKISHLNTHLNNQEFNRNIRLNKSFKDFLFTSKVRFKTPKGIIYSANYRTKSIVPRNNELLTITDNTNPTRIVIGNKNLNRELEHLFSFNIRFYNRKKSLNFFNRISYTTVKDKIIDRTSITDEDAITTKTYINNSNNNKISIRGSISKDYKKSPLFYNFKLRWFGTYGTDSHFINNQSFESKYYRISPSIYSELNYNDVFEILPYYRVSFNKTQYTNNNINSQSNTQHIIGLNITTFAPKNFTIYNQMQYRFNPNIAKYFGRQALVWNITANYSIIPNKAKLKLTVFNLLNQYNNTRQSLSESRNTTSTYDVLQQYAMLSFKYVFKN